MKIRACVALLFLAAVAHAETVRPAQLLKGITFSKRKRLKVADVLVGNVTVKHLFAPIHGTESSMTEYYVTMPSNTAQVRVIGPEQLRALLETMALRHTRTLRVVLRDDRDTFLRHVWPFYEGYFDAEHDITIDETPCEQITHIVYRRVRDRVREQLLEGDTDRHISLNAVFDRLLHDDIATYLRSLGPKRGEPPCLKTYELYQWLKGEDVAGFGFGRYELTDGIRSSLTTVASALLDTRRDWQRSKLRIRIVGYADASKVETKPPLRASATGVKLTDPLVIRYLGCRANTLDEKTPGYVSAGGSVGLVIGDVIENNCQLGAARAYVAAAFLQELLGHGNVDYEYATGGEHPQAGKRDAAYRKLDIDVDLRAASDSR